MTSQSMRSALIAKAVRLLPKHDQKSGKTLAATLFDEVSHEDLLEQDEACLAHLLSKGLSVGKKQSVGLDVINDKQTLITVSMSNRPFIVDSVLAELNAQGLELSFVAHPVIDGSSLVMVIVGATTGQQRGELKSALSKIIKQVRLVTDDWKAMLLRLEQANINFRVTPPPLPAPLLAEVIQFVEWLGDNNFTLLGMQEYSYVGTRKSGTLQPVEKSALGLLKDEDLTVMSRGGKPVVMTGEIRDFLFSKNPIIISKANTRSPVHRRVHLDYIGIKLYSTSGELEGELRIIGLFTSSAYTKSVMNIPLLRHKANAVIANFKADASSHSGKALANILETWPRDELFQIDPELLTEFAKVAVKLDERPRIKVLPRPDKFDHFVSVLVYVPRDRYDSDVRQKIGTYLSDAYQGYVSAFYPAFLENGLTRVHFIIGRYEGKIPVIERATLEASIVEICRTWEDRLVLLTNSPVDHLFPIAYQEQLDIKETPGDIANLESLENESDIALDFHPAGPFSKTDNRIALKLFHLHTAVPLSQRVPLMENLGFKVIEESTYDIVRGDGAPVFLHDLILENANGKPLDREHAIPLIKEALYAIWAGKTDNDNFNALCLRTDMDWRMAGVFRAVAGYLRQIRSRFTVDSMAVTLASYPAITQQLATLFAARFDPKAKSRNKKQAQCIEDINTALKDVSSSDDDRILRNFLSVICAMLRTNFYAPVLTTAGTEEAPTPVLAFKIDPSAVATMPQPVPYREIFVSSPRIEGLHLRFGPVARGGLRWSDRPQDYRTEVLGLVKAQQVKNAVIVPVGSKGGFVPKQLPTDGDRNAWFTEGREAYKIFISSLLSLTDNLIDGKVVPPKDIVRHDGDDPYFVVAADKGTSTFSDTANAISQANNFWLDDAFASGGSAGYDHKKMGITARGGWEAVKRHFREMIKDGKSWDIQSQPFTAAGVGDMSGDVFGNGMLLSKQTRLIAAFDHRDIFIDPQPDEKRSFAERKRLFNKQRSSWQDYNPKLISKGGGVFSRSAKTIPLSKQAAAALGFEAGDHTPQAIMNAILKAPVDLMWFGGIGTYIRASYESDADADDRANDAIRVESKELRCRVIGEGANLGATHPARIEFNMLGGRCNSDAIDNSAGVNSSDVEVNIKIALAAAMKSGRLNRTKRNVLLENMTESVAELVLRNNYLQTLAISITERKGMEDFTHQQRLMQALETRKLLDREVEDLPDDNALAERQAQNSPLTRAEIGVLLAYAKIVALDDLVAGNVPDDPYLKNLLIDYFPPKMQNPYAGEIENHRLRREIIGTVLANSMINRGGASFISRVSDRTGATLDQIARAYVAVTDTFDLPTIYDQIDQLDAKIDGELQLELYTILQERVISQTVWFVRYADFSKGIGAVVDGFRKPIQTITPQLEKIIPDFLVEKIEEDVSRFELAGVPSTLARSLSRMPIAGLIPDIHHAAQQAGKPLAQATTAFFAITEIFRVGRIVQAARGLETSDYYDDLALDRALQSLHMARRDIVVDVLNSKTDVTAWSKTHKEAIDSTAAQLAGIVEQEHTTVSRLTVAANILADMARAN